MRIPASAISTIATVLAVAPARALRLQSQIHKPANSLWARHVVLFRPGVDGGQADRASASPSGQRLRQPMRCGDN
jgi:hypothetical protein